MTPTMNIDVLIGEIAGESGGEIRPDAVRFCLSQLGSLVRDEVTEGRRVEVKFFGAFYRSADWRIAFDDTDNPSWGHAHNGEGE